jgi:conjugative transfer signal peptidase TraF
VTQQGTGQHPSATASLPAPRSIRGGGGGSKIRRSAPLLWAIALAAAYSAVLPAIRLRHNRTESIPRGFYWASPIAGIPARGSTVAFCLPDQLAARARQIGVRSGGRCPNGLEPLGKVLVGLPGDRIRISEAGISVNGSLIPGSAPEAGQWIAFPLPASFELAQEVVLFGPGPKSWDSRYYGPIPASALQEQLAPIWVD